jgi:Family of unknown function (DUF6082)
VHRTRPGRRPLFSFSIGTVALITITTFGSPLLLLLIEAAFGFTDERWAKLSSIGQSFSGMSAILAAAALGAIAYSSRLQARELRVTQLQALRQMHFELMRLPLDDPRFTVVWGAAESIAKKDYEAWRVAVYTNLAFMYLQMSFRIGEVPEGHLRSIAASELFNNENGIRFWTTARTAFISGIPDRRVLDFARILDEEHLAATIRIVPSWVRPEDREPPAPHGPEGSTGQ